MFLLVFGILVILILFCVGLLHINSRYYTISKTLPGSKLYPFFGNSHLFLNKEPVQFLKIVKEHVDKYGKVVRFLAGNQLIVLFCDPKDVEMVLKSHTLTHKSTEYTYLQKWLGEGLLLSTGKKWYSRRKTITPTFHFKILDEFIEVFDRQSDIFVKKLSRYKPTESFDICPYISLCTLDAICETAMGVSINAQTNSDSEYVKAVKIIADIVNRRIFNVFLRINFLFNFSPGSRRQERALKVVHGFTDKVIQTRRAEILKNINDNFEEKQNDDGIKKKMAFLDVLLQATADGRQLTNMEIREEVDTFMFAGHDTATSALSFMFYNIAKYPQVQKKLFEEIRNVVGDDKTKPIGLKELNEFHYMDLVIKETLRMYPSAPIIGRSIREDIVINGKLIPEGTTVGLGLLFMGRDPDIYPNPLEFIPERFSVERNGGISNPYAFVPFSAGPRNCIGQKYAINELKSICSKVLRYFEISTDNEKQKDLTLIAEIILRSADGVFLKISQRIY